MGDVAEYIYPARFPAEDKPLLQSASEETGQSINQLIVRCVEERLPALRAELSPAKGLRPFTKAEARRAFAPDPEWEKLEAAMSRRRVPRPEAD